MEKIPCKNCLSLPICISNKHFGQFDALYHIQIPKKCEPFEKYANDPNISLSTKLDEAESVFECRYVYTNDWKLSM